MYRASFRRRVPLLPLAAGLALLIGAGWMLWPSEPAGAQEPSRKSLLYAFAAVEGETTLSLEALGRTGGVAIEPEFSPTTYSYTVTVPYQEVEFRAKFITIWKGRYINWGWVVVGDLEEYERLTNTASYGTPAFDAHQRMILANAGSARRSRSFTLQQDVAQTIQIGVYRWRSGQVAERMPGSISKTVYTLTVNYEPPAEDNTSLLDLTISKGWLDFDPFDTDASAYTVYVPSDTESVVITPTTTDPDAAATVKGGDPANAVALTSGGNLIPVVVTAEDGETTQTYAVTVFRGSTNNHSALIAQMKEWRNRPEWVRYKAHTDRWDRALLALGETVANPTLTKMTAAQAQAFADISSEWHRWVAVADALRDVEAGTARINAQNQRRQNQEARTLGRLLAPSTVDNTAPQDSDTTNQAPAVLASIGDATIVSAGGTKQVSLSGVFSDADNDALTVTATSSDDAVATVSVASDGSSLTVSAQSRGTATITVTAADGAGGTAHDRFSVTVKAAPVVASAVADVSELAAGATQEVSLSGAFSDADGDGLTITAASDDEAVATVSVASDGSSLTLAGAAEGTATITVTAEDSDGNRVSDDFEVSVTAPQTQEQSQYADLIAQVREWRNDPNGVNNKSHTDRWDRVLLALGETVADSTLTPMTAAEAQEMASRYQPLRWNPVAEALEEIEAAGQQQQSQQQEPANQAPTVSASIADATIVNESGTRTVSLFGVFSDADNDALTVTAASSNEAIATASVASGGSSLTVTAKSRGTATITVTADDGNGGTVEDAFSVTVKAALVVASALADVAGLAAGSTQEVSLSGVFRDPDGDALTITAASNDEAFATVLVASDGSSLTLTGAAQGTATITVTAEDSDGNRVADAFEVSVGGKYAALVAQMYEWRNDPRWSSQRSHTDRWDRALMALGESVSDTSLTAMTAAEAQAFADSGMSRWVNVAAALQAIEAGRQQQQQPQGASNQAPTVSAAIADAIIVSQSGTKRVSLSGVFRDPDNDVLSFSAASSNEAAATVSVAGGSSLTLSARARGTTTITVTADDGRGGTADDSFEVTVKSAPAVASALPDLSGLEAGSTQDVSLSGVFSDADGDPLSVTASSSDETKATVSVAADASSLTLRGVAEGAATITVAARDSDGNRVADAFEVSVVPAPTLTPEPTPEPDPAPQGETSDAVARYDVNDNGKIDIAEYIQAIRDRAAGRLSEAEWREILNAYLDSQYG